MRHLLRELTPVAVVLVVMILVNVIVAFALFRATDLVNQQSYDRCIDRQANTTKLNTFARRMSILEAENKFIDQTLRDERVAAYTSLVLAAPKCGKP